MNDNQRLVLETGIDNIYDNQICLYEFIDDIHDNQNLILYKVKDRNLDLT